MAMGAADVVPGVSGGTIAFITAILLPQYSRNSVGSESPHSIKGIETAWAAVTPAAAKPVPGAALDAMARRWRPFQAAAET